MAARRCLVCRTLIPTGSYCPQHKRNGSTRQWRRLRSLILARDNYRCQICGEPAEHVDHIRPRAEGGTDHPHNLRATCAFHNLSRGG